MAMPSRWGGCPTTLAQTLHMSLSQASHAGAVTAALHNMSAYFLKCKHKQVINTRTLCVHVCVCVQVHTQAYTYSRPHLCKKRAICKLPKMKQNIQEVGVKEKLDPTV
jgi:hypothetical protein